MTNPYQSSADTGSGDVGNALGAHATGDPIARNVQKAPTVGHTWLIIAAALGLLWFLGGIGFKSIRMG